MKERQNLNMALIGPEELVAQEFNQHTKEPTQSEEQCAFDCWEQNHTSFPLMSIAAAQILAVQSSNWELILLLARSLPIKDIT